MERTKVYGRVKWFDSARGYGFLTSDSGQHVFVYYSEILVNGYKSLDEGQTVAFYLTKGPKGLDAIAVEVIEDNTTENTLRTGK